VVTNICPEDGRCMTLRNIATHLHIHMTSQPLKYSPGDLKFHTKQNESYTPSTSNISFGVVPKEKSGLKRNEHWCCIF